jgi:quercetin dioxygenase-like cupin family protein
VVQAGDRVEDPISGASVRFVQTGRETGGESLELDVRVRPRWNAGPLHIHPHQREEVEVMSGSVRSIRGGAEDRHEAGEIDQIAAGMPHTLWNGGHNDAVLSIRFRPALRTAELFETALGVGRKRWTRTRLIDLLRLLWSTRAYRDEFRFSRPDRRSYGAFARALLRSLVR